MPKLDYLFRAEFSDGSSIKQNQEDTSSLVPTKSQYYDVLQKEDKLVRFALVCADDPSYEAASVDLTTGQFTFEGAEVPYCDPSAGAIDAVLHGTEPIPFRLIYFRRVYQHRIMGEEVSCTSETHYFIGWQLTVDGTCYKQTLRLM